MKQALKEKKRRNDRMETSQPVPCGLPEGNTLVPLLEDVPLLEEG